jgi:hypothetical protein
MVSTLEAIKRKTAFKVCFQIQLVPLHNGGPHKSVVQLALERLSFSSNGAQEALSAFEEEQELQLTGGGHSKAAVADKQVGLAWHFSHSFAVKTHSIDDSRYVPCM